MSDVRPFEAELTDYDMETLRRVVRKMDQLGAEIKRLRSMLPQKVDGLPTEPGWYFYEDGMAGGVVDVVNVFWDEHHDLHAMYFDDMRADFMPVRYMPDGYWWTCPEPFREGRY